MHTHPVFTHEYMYTQNIPMCIYINAHNCHNNTQGCTGSLGIRSEGTAVVDASLYGYAQTHNMKQRIHATLGGAAILGVCPPWAVTGVNEINQFSCSQSRRSTSRSFYRRRAMASCVMHILTAP